MPQNYTEAVRLFTLSSDANAQIALSSCHINGLGVTRNVSEGVRLCKMAAEGGSDVAQCMLAEWHEAGDLAPLDISEALRWYKCAATAGIEQAQRRLSELYSCSERANDPEAVHWHRLAADKSDAALFNLAVCYLNGNGVPSDTKEGVRLMIRAAEQGFMEAQAYLGSWAPRNARARAARLCRLCAGSQAAEQGPLPQHNLGTCYWNGGRAPGPSSRCQWFTRARRTKCLLSNSAG